MRGKLRQKQLKSGKISLYIDYYPPVWNPIRQEYSRREFLELYLHSDPQTSLERKQNALSMEVAEKIYLKRMKSLMLSANGLYDADILEASFYTYYDNFIKKRSKDIDVDSYISTLNHLKKWQAYDVKFKHIDELFLEGFKSYLKTATQLKSKHLKLAPNSQACYFDHLALVVYQAFLDRYLPEDYTIRVKRLPNVDSRQRRLEVQDIKLLLDNPCDDELVFRSSMFAYNSGFRFSAVEILEWDHLHFSTDLNCWYIYLIDPKPDRPFKHFISDEAMKYVGERRDGSKYVFEGLNYSKMRYRLIQWFDDVGLKDKARFHNWRRRYASDLSENDVDIYVIKDMLNHKWVKTTEIYTDVSDSSKAKAAKAKSLNAGNKMIGHG